MLHDTVVASFLWGGWHLWAFQVADRAYGIPDPEHRLGGSRIYRPESLRHRDIIAKGIKQFDYLYDFDAEWRHRIDIEAVTEGSAPGGYPRFVEGEGRCPPENVGGPQDYAAFLEAVANPERPATLISSIGMTAILIPTTSRTGSFEFRSAVSPTSGVPASSPTTRAKPSADR